METLVLALLVVQGIMGGIDTLLNHELLVGIPRRPELRRETGLHVIREAIWAALFIGLAWFAWHGAAALVIAALLAAEVLNTACDEFVENRLRVLPQNERVLHVLLVLNLGAVITLLAPILLDWSSEATGLQLRQRGALSWALTALGLAAGAWSLRDLVAWRRVTVSAAREENA